MSNLQLVMGAMSKSLAEQFKEQGLTPPQNIEMFQLDVDAITRLKIRGYLPDSVAQKARQRLMKDIAKAK